MAVVTEREISTVCDAIVRAFKPERVILFGSHAAGAASAHSDVDLLVVMSFEGSAIEKGLEVIEAIRPRIPLDLIVRRPDDLRRRLALHDFFLTQAVRGGRVLYESSRG